MTEGSVAAGGGSAPEVPQPRRPAQRRASSPRKRAKKAAAAGGGFGGTLMLSLGHQVPQDSVWATILTWSSPGFAALAGAVLPMLKEQGGRWGVNFKVWRSRRVLMKMSRRDDISPERKAELEAFLDEVDKHRAHDEIARIREAFSRD